MTFLPRILLCFFSEFKAMNTIESHPSSDKAKEILEIDFP